MGGALVQRSSLINNLLTYGNYIVALIDNHRERGDVLLFCRPLEPIHLLNDTGTLQGIRKSPFITCT